MVSKSETNYLSGTAVIPASSPGASGRKFTKKSPLFSRGAGTANTVMSGLVVSANLYKGAVDSVYTVASEGFDCAQAALSVVGRAWERGFYGNLTEIAKAAVGVSDLGNAVDALCKSSVEVDGKNVRIPFSNRIGTAVGHVTNAACKTVASGAAMGGAMTYSIGATRNALGMGYSTDTFYAGAQLVATGVNMAVKAVSNPAMALTGSFFSGIGKGAVFFAKNPAGLATVVVPFLGSGALLYAAAYEVENATASTGKVAKYFHGTMATALAASALCVPGLGYAAGLTG